MRAIPCALLALLLAGCPGQTTIQPGDSAASDAPRDGAQWGDGPGGRDDNGPGPGADTQPPDPCATFAQAGQSCAGGQSCPQGTVPVAIGGPCTCHVPCNPASGSHCSPKECDYLCVQLVDSKGNPLPGQGACVADNGAPEGEPCTPQCRQSLYCVAHSAKAAFCRRTCQAQGDCTAFKMVCGELQSPKVKVCIPGGSTTGPKKGDSCAGANDYCQQGLICDPDTKVCLEACDPNTSHCTAPQSCSKLADGITIGYGCK